MHVLLVEDNELNAEIAMEVLKNKGILVNWVRMDAPVWKKFKIRKQAHISLS